ncbi:unnamed protein product [Adineta ricciae]|uniref:G-protein coupled receptors family 1 profile domain-containing protein n=1 Tax=Adineta ricciae TaxID=249248 RepID=A0A816FT36_ADIRI|nr:unnamed protein product [Adineta ricciae]
MIYFNTLESFYLTALNVCRYWQIVRNQNIYNRHPHFILSICAIIPLFILINMIVQDQMSWCNVVENVGESCSVTYSSIPIRIWNVALMFALPIIISLIASIRCVLHIKQTHSQQVLSRRNHHRQLIYRFGIFYTVWIILWGPFVLLTYLDIKTISDQIDFFTSIGSTLEVAIDGILVSALDKHFEMAWKKTYDNILHQLGLDGKKKVRPIHQLTLVMHDRMDSKDNIMNK